MKPRRSRLAIALALAWVAAGHATGATGSGASSPPPATAPAAAPVAAAPPRAPDAAAEPAPRIEQASSPTPVAAGNEATGPLSGASAPAATDPEATPQPAPADAGPALAGAAAPPALRRGEDVFARIRTGLSRDPCAAGEASTRWQKRYAVNPRALSLQFERILPLLDFVSVEVARSGLPAEFVFIPLVESWYKPEAIGVGGPAGMWQMIGTTAKNHGIRIRAGYDGRLSPVESTRAALSYLKVLYAMFGGWEATVMAYNAGEGRLLQAFKRARSREASGNRRRPHGLSNITYDYVAKLQALSCLVTQPERHRLALPLATRFVPLAPVQIEPGIGSLDQFARRTGRDQASLRKLNPGFRNGQVVAGVPRLVLMPLSLQPTEPPSTPPAAVVASATPAAAAVAAVASPEVLPVEPASAASTDAARAAGGSLTVPATAAPAAGAGQPAAGAPATPATPAVAAGVPPVAAPPVSSPPVAAAPGDAAPVRIPPAAATTHVVSAGDSLWSIGKAYRISVEDLRTINDLGKASVLRPGQTLKLQR